MMCYLLSQYYGIDMDRLLVSWECYNMSVVEALLDSIKDECKCPINVKEGEQNCVVAIFPLLLKTNNYPEKDIMTAQHRMESSLLNPCFIFQKIQTPSPVEFASKLDLSEEPLYHYYCHHFAVANFGLEPFEVCL